MFHTRKDGLRYLICTLSSLLLWSGGHALAQALTPTPPAGEEHFVARVKSVAGNNLTVTMNDGTSRELVVPPTLKILHSVRASISALQTAQRTGAVIGCTAPKADGELKASECHVFPSDMKMPGGHVTIPTGDTMTMGKVSSIQDQPRAASAANAGYVVVVSYPGGERRIEVGPTTPITEAGNISLSEVKPGDEAHVGVQKIDGRPTVSFLADSTL